jgi:hypothetical protein
MHGNSVIIGTRFNDSKVYIMEKDISFGDDKYSTLKMSEKSSIARENFEKSPLYKDLLNARKDMRSSDKFRLENPNLSYSCITSSNTDLLGTCVYSVFKCNNTKIYPPESVESKYAAIRLLKSKVTYDRPLESIDQYIWYNHKDILDSELNKLILNDSTILTNGITKPKDNFRDFLQVMIIMLEERNKRRAKDTRCDSIMVTGLGNKRPDNTPITIEIYKF